MKKAVASLFTLSVASITAMATPLPTDWKAGFHEGNPEFQSISQLAFGPDNILFLADTKAAAVVALARAETSPITKPIPHGIEDPAGNNIGKSFDVDLHAPAGHPAAIATTRISFTIP